MALLAPSPSSDGAVMWYASPEEPQPRSSAYMRAPRLMYVCMYVCMYVAAWENACLVCLMLSVCVSVETVHSMLVLYALFCTENVTTDAKKKLIYLPF